MASIRVVPAILSEAANLLGKIWTAASQSWYAKAAVFFFAARPFLVSAATVRGLKKAARSLENAAEIRARSLEKAAEIQGRSLENAARILAQR